MKGALFYKLPIISTMVGAKEDFGMFAGFLAILEEKKTDGDSAEAGGRCKSDLRTGPESPKKNGKSLHMNTKLYPPFSMVLPHVLLWELIKALFYETSYQCCQTKTKIEKIWMI